MRFSMFTLVRLMMLASLASLLVYYLPSNDFRNSCDIDPLPDTRTRGEALSHYVRKTCEALDFNKTKKQLPPLQYMIYDDTHRVIYCYIPKVSCTSWKRVFLNITRNHTKHLQLLYSSKNAEEKLQTYKKFMFVRHPFERALSAFRNKVEGSNGNIEFKTSARKIKEKYRGTTNGNKHNVTFSEFIRYISELGPDTPYQQNDHWLPMHELCGPCSVEYDFIGRLENLEEDTDYVLRWLGVKELVSGLPPATNAVNASKHVTKYLEQLNTKERLAFYEHFLLDYLLFDYKFL